MGPRRGVGGSASKDHRDGLEIESPRMRRCTCTCLSRCFRWVYVPAWIGAHLVYDVCVCAGVYDGFRRLCVCVCVCPYAAMCVLAPWVAQGQRI